MQTRPLAILGVGLALQSARMVSADGLGKLLFNQPPAGFAAVEAPLRAFRMVGTCVDDPSVGHALGAILANGNVFVHAEAGSPFLDVPTGLGEASDVRANRDFVAALDVGGRVWTWGPRPAVTSNLTDIARIAVSRTVLATVAHGGQVRLWNPSGEVAPASPIMPAVDVAVARDWGVAIGPDGALQGFGHSGGSSPSIAWAGPARSVAIAGGWAAPIGMAIELSGSIVSLTDGFRAEGTYAQVAVSPKHLVALSQDGRVQRWFRSDQAAPWGSPLPVAGVFASISVPQESASTSAIFAVHDWDTDRNGVHDSEDVAIGLIPDVNGDLVDDRIQTPSSLFDTDGNAIPDASESATVAGQHAVPNPVWYVNASSAYRVAFLAADRIPPHARILRRVTWHHAPSPKPGSQCSYCLPPTGLPVTYGIWLDPNSDGNPDDAVSIGTWDAVMNPNGTTSIDLGGVWIGPPGTCFFQGVVYQSPAAGFPRPGVIPADRPLTPAGTPLDILSLSRNRGRILVAMVETGAGTLIDRVRSFESYFAMGSAYDWGYSGMIFPIALGWGERLEGDCDSDGSLDVDVLNSNGYFYGSQLTTQTLDHDADNNGLIDTCESDCDGNGMADVTDIAQGAADCDRNLVLDSCGPAGLDVAADAWFPGPGASVGISIATPEATGIVRIDVEARGDLGAPSEALVIRLGDGPPRSVFRDGGHDCPASPDAEQIFVTPAEFNAARAGGSLQLSVEATPAADSTSCADATLRVRFRSSPASDDCDGNRQPDRCVPAGADCDANGVPDECELALGAPDIDGNGILDRCQLDCNRNAVPDGIELEAETSLDCNGDGILDECQLLDDCDGDGIADPCDPTCDGCSSDCDGDGIPNNCEIRAGSPDADANGIPDDCQFRKGDLDLDGRVSGSDLGILMGDWGTSAARSDIDRSGTVTGLDLGILLGNWGQLAWP